MAGDSTSSDAAEELSPEEIRRRLIRLLGKRDMEKHEQIYEDLARGNSRRRPCLVYAAVNTPE